MHGSEHLKLTTVPRNFLIFIIKCNGKESYQSVSTGDKQLVCSCLSWDEKSTDHQEEERSEFIPSVPKGMGGGSDLSSVAPIPVQ